MCGWHNLYFRRLRRFIPRSFEDDRRVKNENCTFCQGQTEKLIHLFWDYPKIQSFLYRFVLMAAVMRSYHKINTLTTRYSSLGLKPDTSEYKQCRLIFAANMLNTIFGHASWKNVPQNYMIFYAFCNTSMK